MTSCFAAAHESGSVQVFGRRQRRDARHAELAGVQKAPRHEVAGSWARTGQRAYEDLMRAPSSMIGVVLTEFDLCGCRREVSRLH
jgi:hypothetical protein